MQSWSTTLTAPFDRLLHDIMHNPLWRPDMQRLCLLASIAFVLSCVTFVSTSVSAAEPVTLIGTIVKWRYPGAEICKSEMSDAATVDAEGNRTVPSSILKTTMVTPEAVDKVLDFYRDLLTLSTENDGRLGLEPSVGRSVVFSDESEGRRFAFHTIVVNYSNISTTLVITRGEDEQKTFITWTQYIKHDVGE
jgi:hypothetical protein